MSLEDFALSTKGKSLPSGPKAAVELAGGSTCGNTASST